MHFAMPHYLWLLPLLVVLMLAIQYIHFRAFSRLAQSYGEPQAIARFSRLPTKRDLAIDATLWVLICALLVVTLADPFVSAPGTAQTGSMKLIAVVDVSKSMAAEAYRDTVSVEQQAAGSNGTSVDMVEELLVEQILPGVLGNRVGIVKYVGHAFVQAYLTDDYAALTWIIRHWLKQPAPGGGSDIAAGLAQALVEFAEDETLTGTAGSDKVIVLFSDGGFDLTDKELAATKEQRLKDALKEIRRLGINLVVVGLGPDQQMSIPQYNDQGQFTGFYKDKNLVAMTRINESLLRYVADEGHGKYIRYRAGMRVPIDWTGTIAGTKRIVHSESVYRYSLTAAAFLLLVALRRPKLFGL